MALPKEKTMIKDSRAHITEQLQKVIPRLKHAIDNHTKDLKSNEALTRSALVNPMLQALGWNVEDPAEVVPECSVSRKGTGNQVADYVLFTKHRKGAREPRVVIEVKSLRASNMNQADGQALKNARDIKAEYYAITDGERWELHKFTTRNTEKITEFNLGTKLTQHLINNLSGMALPLSKQYLGGADLPSADAQQIPPSSTPSGRKRTALPQATRTPPISDTQWVPLTEARQTLQSPTVRSRPKFIVRFPNGIEKTATGWVDLSRIVISWLDQNQILSNNNLTKVPFKKNGRELFASIQPRRASGKLFAKPYLASDSGLHFEMHRSSDILIQGIITLLRMVNRDPDSILVGLKLE